MVYAGYCPASVFGLIGVQLLLAVRTKVDAVLLYTRYTRPLQANSPR